MIILAILFSLVMQLDAQWTNKKEKADELKGTPDRIWYTYTSSLGRFFYANTDSDFLGITTNQGIFDFNNGILECTVGFYNSSGKLVSSEKCILENDENMSKEISYASRNFTNDANKAIDSLIDNYVTINNISKTEETVEFLYHLFDHEIDSIRVNLEKDHNFYVEDKVINYLANNRGKVRFIIPRYQRPSLDMSIPCKKSVKK